MRNFRQILAQLFGGNSNDAEGPQSLPVAQPDISVHGGRKQRRKLLIIDDEVDLCLLMKQYFVRKNFEVYIAHSCSDGINRARLINPDEVIIEKSLFAHSANCLRKLQEAAPNARITSHPRDFKDL